MLLSCPHLGDVFGGGLGWTHQVFDSFETSSKPGLSCSSVKEDFAAQVQCFVRSALCVALRDWRSQGDPLEVSRGA